MSLTREDGQLRIEGGSGSGDVVGPSGATDGNIVLFDGATGKLIKDSGVQISSLIGGSTRAALTFFALDGEDGSDGFVSLNVPGPQGIQGIQGLNGTNGTNGTNGISGEDGIDGLDGFSIVGPQGIAGTNGNDGIPGTNGISGLNGLDGDNGDDAYFGLPGRDGAAGINGLDGTQPTALIDILRYAFKRISFLESVLKFTKSDIQRQFVIPDEITILGDFELWNSNSR